MLNVFFVTLVLPNLLLDVNSEYKEASRNATIAYAKYKGYDKDVAELERLLLSEDERIFLSYASAIYSATKGQVLYYTWSF